MGKRMDNIGFVGREREQVNRGEKKKRYDVM